MKKLYLQFEQHSKGGRQPADLVIVHINMFQVLKLSEIVWQLCYESVGQIKLNQTNEIDDVRGDVVDNVLVVVRRKIIDIPKVNSVQIFVLAQQFWKSFESAIFCLDRTKQTRFFAQQV